MKQVIEFPAKILEPLKNFLINKKKKLEKQKEELEKEDPFADKSRLSNNAAIDAEASEQSVHARVLALKGEIDRRLIDVRKTLTKIKLGKYGLCETCGKLIDTDRLAVDPTVLSCIDCSKKKMKIPKTIFESDDYLIIDKPYGLVVNRAESVKEKTLQDWIESSLDFDLSNNDEFRNGIVHRLDKETSGVMVVAKTKKMFEELQRQFRDREVGKEYVALVHGKIEPKSGSMSLPLSRSRSNRKRFSVSLGGKKSETYWEVDKYLEKNGDRYALVNLMPKTGRTHQLRVHMKHLGHPIVGDSKYVGKGRLKKDLSWCKRLFLHARKLCINVAGEKKCFESDLASDLRRCLGEFFV